MDKIQDLFKQISQEVAAEYSIIDAEKQKVADSKNQVAAKKKSLDEREEIIASKEKEIAERLEDISRQENIFKKVKDMTAWDAELSAREVKMEKDNKKNADAIAELKLKEEMLQKAQLEQSRREQDYRKEIKQEVVSSFFKLGE